MILIRSKQRLILSCSLTLITLLLPVFSHSQDLPQINSARTAGLGGCSVAIPDPWSALNNQAGLGWQRDYTFGVFHENRYLVKELGYSVLIGCIPVKPGTFGINISHFGYSQFNQSRFGLSYGMMLSKQIAAGVGINYHTLTLPKEYGSISTITAEGGILYQPIENLLIGAYASNPTQSSFGSDKKIPTSFGLGLTFRPNRYLSIVLQEEDNNASDPVFRMGLEYNPVERISIRTGLASKPVEIAFGLGWRSKHLNFDLAFSYHQVLGYTPFASISYTIGRAQDIQDKPNK